MIVPRIHVRTIDLSMLRIETFRRDIVTSALRARDMTLGPHRHSPDDIRVAVEAIDDVIETCSPHLMGNWVTAYVRPNQGQPQLLTTYEIREVSLLNLDLLFRTYTLFDNLHMLYTYRQP